MRYTPQGYPVPTWIIQASGSAFCTHLNYDDAQPNGDWLPAGSEVVAFLLPPNNDLAVSNFSIVNGVLNYLGAPIPNPDGLRLAILSDATISDTEKATLVLASHLIDRYLIDSAGVKAAWAIMKSAGSVSSDTQSKVEAYFSQFNMPLV